MEHYFPCASRYAQWAKLRRAVVQEQRSHYHAGFHWSERHLQCIWFDPRYRPGGFRLAGQETVTVLDPGTWNLEPGPDFLNATLVIQPGGRHLRGDVEIHVHPTDWDHHGHSSDQAYRAVVAHVTWFPGPLAKSLPSGVLALALAEPLSARWDLSLDDIDLKAYPYSILPETPRPCEAFLKKDPERARDLLQAAGHYRLQAKAARLRARLLQTGDRHQLFYEEFMAALGYKHNQQAFRTLARWVPAARLKGLQRDAAYAVMLAAGGLLPDPDLAPDAEAQAMIRNLWDLAWKHAGETPASGLEWHTPQGRPQNAPVRRLAAAAALFSGLRDLLCDVEQFKAASGRDWFGRVSQRIAEHCEWPFWNQRLAFSSLPEADHPHVLIGKGRLAAIITNVLLPFLAAEELLPDEALCYLPPEDTSSPMRLTALHLFGRDHNPAAYYADNGLLQQGLLQIQLDFCLSADPECAGCELCEHLRR